MSPGTQTEVTSSLAIYLKQLSKSVYAYRETITFSITINARERQNTGTVFLYQQNMRVYKFEIGCLQLSKSESLFHELVDKD